MWSAGAAPLPSAVGLLMTLERLVYGLPADDVTEAVSRADFARFAAVPDPDLVLDFTDTRAGRGTRTWRITFDGVADEAAALAAADRISHARRCHH